MKAIEFPEATGTAVGEGFHSLPVCMAETSIGCKLAISCWELTPEEIEMVKKTGHIYAMVLTSDGSLPPMAMSADRDSIFEDIKTKEEEQAENTNDTYNEPCQQSSSEN